MIDNAGRVSPSDSTQGIDRGNTHDQTPVPSLPERFGKYTIVREIGRGATGVVYEAQDPDLDRRIALKVMLSGEHASEREVKRFLREAKAIASIRHPNIVPVHDAGEIGGRHYFTMDYVEGSNLADCIREKKPDEAFALDVVEQVADAVVSAHEAGVIHRDIKPSNIMIHKNGKVMITDFGLAVRLYSGSRQTRPGTTIGTPAYMPPEQARGEIDKVSERSDVYSLGAVLYELLTGIPPFDTGSLLDTVTAVVNFEPVPPRKIDHHISRDLQTIVLKTLQKDPEDRYASMAELRDDVRRYRKGEAILARPPSFFYRLSRLTIRRPAGVPGRRAPQFVLQVLLLTSLLALALVWAMWNAYRPPRGDAARAEWREVYSSSLQEQDLEPFWSRVQGYTGPVGGVLRKIPEGVELSTRHPDPFYGDVRMSFTVTVSPGAGAARFGCGLVGAHERAPTYASVGDNRITIYGLKDIEAAFTGGASDPVVLADRALPDLKPGKYRVSFEKNRLVTVLGISGEGISESLKYANIHFSNWRVKNLDLVVRFFPGRTACSDLLVEQLFQSDMDMLDTADDRFFRGDYNGAIAGYLAVGKGEALSSRRIEAFHRLGLYHETKSRFEEALASYAKVIEAFNEDWASAGEHASAVLRQIGLDATLRSFFCSERLRRTGQAVQSLESFCRFAGPLSEPWCWHVPGVVGNLVEAGEVDAAVFVFAASDLPCDFGPAGEAVAEVRNKSAAGVPGSFSSLNSVLSSLVGKGDFAAAGRLLARARACFSSPAPPFLHQKAASLLDEVPPSAKKTIMAQLDKTELLLAGGDGLASWLVELGDLLLYCGMNAEAEIRYRRAADMLDTSLAPQAALRLGAFLELTGRTAEALELWQDFPQRYPQALPAREVAWAVLSAHARGGTTALPELDAAETVFWQGVIALVSGERSVADETFDRVIREHAEPGAPWYAAMAHLPVIQGQSTD